MTIPHLSSWVHINLVSNLRPIWLRKLLDHGYTPERVLGFSHADFRSVGFTNERANRILHEIKNANPAREIQATEELGAQIIPMGSPDYPPLLNQLSDPPFLLYVKGKLPPKEETCLAIVGARSCTPYGRQLAESFAESIGSCGVPIISGLALGIDGAAHQGALSGNGTTVAILGCGIDQIYPRKHWKLSEEIQTRGAIVSEFPIGTQPVKLNFPRRNRIISGLSSGVLVVEAANKSGSLITVDFALEQGKDIFCIPGALTSRLSEGTHRLIREGASLVTHPDQILESLHVAREDQTGQDQADPASSPLPIRCDDPLSRVILESVAAAPLTLSEILVALKIPCEEAARALTRLEVERLVERGAEGKYSSVEGFKNNDPKKRKPG